MGVRRKKPVTGRAVGWWRRGARLTAAVGLALAAGCIPGPTKETTGFVAGGTLRTEPTTGLFASGDVGGPFTPASAAYVLQNTSTSTITWAASAGQPWILLSGTGGQLGAGMSTVLGVSIDQSAAASLPAGKYSGTVRVINESNGSGTTTRTVDLTVGASTEAMGVSPLAGLSSAGTSGGTFAPKSITYTITNTGGGALDWTASATQSWLTLSSSGGQLGAGGQALLTVAIDETAAGALPVGNYTDTVLLTNQTNGSGNTSRTVILSVASAANTFFVSPDVGLVSAGPPSGPFAPASTTYTLSNLGISAIDWSASGSEAWIGVAPSSGQVAPGGQTFLTVSIDASSAASLSPGVYSGNVDIADLTNGTGDTSRTVDLTVTAGGEPLVTTPSQGLVSSGVEGGSFAPPSQAYTLTNTGGSTLSWSAGASKPWILLSSSGGQIAGGGQATLTVSIDQSAAAALSLGTYSGTVQIVDQTNGGMPTGRSVTLNVLASGGTSNASALSQFGITWTFDQPYPVGQFANGDWWVVGPVTVTDISPPSTQSGGRTSNGSMVNPVPATGGQGYDSAAFSQYATAGSYSAANNAAFNVSPGNPLVLASHSSLISSISIPAAGNRPQLQSAAVLTVLPSAAPDGSFRPPYCGTDKTIRFNKSQLDYSQLASLPAPGEAPPLALVEGWFGRPWIDHNSDWLGRWLHPSENMPDYGREISDQIGTAALMLQLDFTDNEKETLLVRFVQLGIDLFGIVENVNGSLWPANGGHHSGRKWPIIFAGLMLGDASMANVGFDPNVTFAEDEQTFYVAQTSPGVYNYGFGGYGPQDVGLPEWGVRHGYDPSVDDSTWFGNPYRTCCTANVWWGNVLAARIMGAQALWNHDALFDYLDRYRSHAPTTGQAGWTISWTGFPLLMWDTYRSSF